MEEGSRIAAEVPCLTLSSSCLLLGNIANIHSAISSCVIVTSVQAREVMLAQIDDAIIKNDLVTNKGSNGDSLI